MGRRFSTEESFWKNVDKNGAVAREDLGPCWLWTGYKTGPGGMLYGQFTINYQRDKAHRWAWRFLVGEIPKGLYVCHKCDVPLCVRPDHLFLGTAMDNFRDSVAKGRREGIQHGPLPFISPDKVVALREEYLSNRVSYRELSRKHGLTISTVARALNGTKPHQLTPDTVREIRRRHASGEKQNAIALDIGTSAAVVNQVVLRRTWAQID